MTNNPFQARRVVPVVHRWEDRALCRGREGEFAPDEASIQGHNGTRWMSQIAPSLIETCMRCPVLAQCDQRRQSLLAAGSGIVGVMAGQASLGHDASRWRTKTVPLLV